LFHEFIIHFVDIAACPVPSFENLDLPPGMVADLRSDHAGESGAVAIYRGILAVSRDVAVRRFAATHLETEISHLRFFEAWLPARHHTRLLPVARFAGWSLGASAALFGRRSVYRTIAAVETFVEGHYVEQIERMARHERLRPLAARLAAFCDDEVDHRDDALARAVAAPGLPGRAWTWFVGIGSAIGVAVARRI
jgi:ubiquinone biosynthesis monooxygenase Coq7